MTDVREQSGASGYVLADDGRWTEAALNRLPAGPLKWVHGALGWAATIDNVTVGAARRVRRDHPWRVNVTGFEFWTGPTKVMPRWHYSPVSSVAQIEDAKRLLERLIETRPALTTDAMP